MAEKPKTKSTTRRPGTSRKCGYEAKRKFSSTPEPVWQQSRADLSQSGAHLFVIHKHAARRLHYDLRLDIDGALASWAVPKGLPMEHGQKHLAIKVEDHPLDYGEFEGNIPPGNYGAGAVMLWDRGLYQVLEKDPATAVRQGHLSLVFAGEKIHGNWTLVRTHPADDKEQWLLFKGKDNDLQLSPEEDNRSVASGRTLEQIAQQGEATELKFTAPSWLESLPPALPRFAPPMKPHLAQAPPRHGDWIYEIKFDGYRILAIKDGGETTLYSRNHKDVSQTFSAIRDAVAALPIAQAVIDGEVVALLESGLSSFQLLQNRGRPGRPEAPPIYCYCFDLLNLEGHDTTRIELHQRKQLLQDLLQGQPDPLRFSAGIESDPDAFLAHAKEIGLEGIIAKEVHSSYQVGRRSRSWLKIKLHHEQEFVIGGYTAPKGSRSRFGALLLGVYDGKTLNYVGRVGTGFDERALEDAYQRFQPFRTDRVPFANLPAPRRNSFGTGLTAAEMKRCVWLKPDLVCQVRFSEWTDDGSIRHPVFLAFRDDKPPREIRREQPVSS